jgi:hypothetical protein
MYYRYMRYRDFIDDVSRDTRDMSPDGLLRRLRFASYMHLLPDGGNYEDDHLLTLITHFTQAVEAVWNTIFHREIQTQRMPDDAPPRRTEREWCRMYIAAFYKAKLLRGVTTKLQHAFRVFLRSLETVFLVDEDTSRALLYSTAAVPPTPPLSPTTLSNGEDNPAPHPFVLRDRFSETQDLGDTVSATTVTSFVSAHMDGRTQVCSLRTPPLPFHLVINSYRTTDCVPDNAYARLNMHVHDCSDVHEAHNTFLFSVVNDVLERGGTHREL